MNNEMTALALQAAKGSSRKPSQKELLEEEYSNSTKRPCEKHKAKENKQRAEKKTK